jgi:hypothetical protein
MPWVSAELNSSFFDIAGQGPLAQSAIVQDVVPYGPTTIAAAGNYSTGIIVSDGYKVVAVAITSTTAGALNIQRYLDREGTIPVTAVLSTPIVATTPLIVIVNGSVDNLPFASFSIVVTNTSGGTGTINKFYCLLQSF